MDTTPPPLEWFVSILRGGLLFTSWKLNEFSKNFSMFRGGVLYSLHEKKARISLEKQSRSNTVNAVSIQDRDSLKILLEKKVQIYSLQWFHPVHILQKTRKSFLNFFEKNSIKQRLTFWHFNKLLQKKLNVVNNKNNLFLL